MRRLPGFARVRRVLTTTAASMTLVAVAGTVPASAAPSAADIARAKHKAAAAKAHLGDLRDAAEIAVEAYHAAVVAETKAHAVALDKAQLAVKAAADAKAAAGAAAAAQAAAERLQERADQARQALAAAAAKVGVAESRLNSIAVSAYESGGRLSQFTSVIDSGNPMEFSQAQAMVDQVGAYQQSVIDDLAVAKAQQGVATQAAAEAAGTAANAAKLAQQRAQAASAAADHAAGAARDAADADAAARRATDAASAAKAHAADAVSAQSRVVHHLQATVSQLEAAAAEARRQAALARQHHVSVPSNAAGIAIQWAYKEIGVPYSWGGGDANGPTYGVAQGANILGFDCSGLTLFAYAHAGITLDHYTGSQWNSGPHIDQAHLLPGDLVFFATNTSDPATIHHVGLYIGNGQMIEAPETGLVVRVSGAFRPDYIGAVRPWARH